MKKTAIILSILALFVQNCIATTPEYTHKNIPDTNCFITVDGYNIELNYDCVPEESTKKKTTSPSCKASAGMK